MNHARCSVGARAPEPCGLYPIRPEDAIDDYPAGPPTPEAAADEQEPAAGEEQGEAADEQAPEHPAEEARAARPARDPGAPTQAERDALAATHLPFRSWCEECVHGRSDAPPHCRTKRVVQETCRRSRSTTPS